MIELDQYPDYLKVPAAQVNYPAEALRPGEDAFVYGSGFITVEPHFTGFSWRLKNEIRDIRWEALVWLVGERFVLELSDLDDVIVDHQTYLTHTV